MDEKERQEFLTKEYEHLRELSRTVEPPKKPRLGRFVQWFFWLASIGAIAFAVSFYFQTTDFAILSLATLLCLAGIFFFCVFFHGIFIQFVKAKKAYRLYEVSPEDYRMQQAFHFLLDEKVREQIVWELSHGIGVKREKMYGFLWYGSVPHSWM